MKTFPGLLVNLLAQLEQAIEKFGKDVNVNIDGK